MWMEAHRPATKRLFFFCGEGGGEVDRNKETLFFCNPNVPTPKEKIKGRTTIHSFPRPLPRLLLMLCTKTGFIIQATTESKQTREDKGGI
jgi:hypothetical protein